MQLTTPCVGAGISRSAPASLFCAGSRGGTWARLSSLGEPNSLAVVAGALTKLPSVSWQALTENASSSGKGKPVEHQRSPACLVNHAVLDVRDGGRVDHPDRLEIGIADVVEQPLSPSKDDRDDVQVKLVKHSS